METYLTLLYVTLEQEVALKDFFTEKGWQYCKPDLSVLTDKVGPVENPQSLKTGGTVTDCGLNEHDRYEKTNTDDVLSSRLGKKVKTPTDVEDIKVEFITADEFTTKTVDTAKDDTEEQTENDDGDNDDDFADDLAINEEENNTADSFLPKTHGKRVVRKSPSKQDRKNCHKTQQIGCSSIDQQECLATSRKRRKVADKTVAKIGAALSEEHEETDLKPLVPKENKVVKREKRPPPGVTKKCTLCPREFRFQFNLDRHCKLKHDPDKTDKPKRKREKGPQQCDICGSVFTRSDSLLDHKRRVHEGVRKVHPAQICTCDVCGASFTRRTHLKEHFLVKHSNSKRPLACHLCEKSFIRARFLQMHLNRDHLKIKPYECQFCNKKFYSEFSAKNHTKLKICRPDRVKNLKCIHCEKRFQDANHLEMHMTAKHFGGAYKCVCGEVVAWSSSIAKHKRKCKDYQEYVAVNGEASKKLCNVIEVQYSDVFVENTAENNTGVSNTADKASEIDRSKESTSKLDCYMNEENKDKESLYDKQYFRSLLTEALKSSPSGKETAKSEFSVCPQCKKSIRNTSMRRHLLSHLDLPYRCTRCTLFFTSEAALEKHRQEKHIGEFVCRYCGMEYRFKNSLAEHIQTRHLGTAKMYECPVCGVKMCRKSHMDDHMNVHNNVNPYSCEICGKSYKNKSAYKRHLKDCGSGNKYICDECGQIYKSAAGLQDHSKRCHDKTFSYLCYCVCRRSFKTRASRCRHRLQCDIYKKEKGSKSNSFEQNITILRVTSTPKIEHRATEYSRVSQIRANEEGKCQELSEVFAEHLNENGNIDSTVETENGKVDGVEEEENSELDGVEPGEIRVTSQNVHA